jgi:nucleotide-binding universal stress UspA family protein
MPTTILILYDFTEIADFALHHGIRVGKNLGIPLTLLHIIHSPQIKLEELDEETQKKKVTEITQRLEEVAKHIEETQGIKLSHIVKHGNIFTDIGDFEKEVNASLIIMGTHGSKGIQQFIGSNVVRVIAVSTIPFIVVQKNVAENGYKKIVVPIDFSKEIDGLKHWLIRFAKQYQSTVYLFNNSRPNHAVQDLIHKNSENIVKALGKEKIKFSVRQAAVDKETFAQQVIEYANGVGADIIMIVSNQAKGLSDFFLI